MHIWRKQASADWVRGRLEELRGRFGPALAIIESAGKARSLVEVATTKKQGRNLVREFGGKIEALPSNWLQQLTRQNRTRPISIGSRLRVTQTGEPRSEREICIPAEAAFGTGEHATTAMCLRILERVTRGREPGWTMLDAGTGSGILAIAASRFGAKDVIAIDNDPRACATAKRNARVNGARQIEFQTGDVLKQNSGGKFDVITGNLFADILIDALPRWRGQLAANGCLIVSGILRSQENAVVTALRRNGFVPDEIRRRGKWVAVLASPARKKS